MTQTARQQNIEAHLQGRSVFEMAEYANTLSNIAKSGYGDNEQKQTLSKECERAVEALCAGIQQNQQQQRA